MLLKTCIFRRTLECIIAGNTFGKTRVFFQQTQATTPANLNFYIKVDLDLLHKELFRSHHEVAKFIELTFSPNAFVSDNNDLRLN